MIANKAFSVFNFLRGAVRSSYGEESFRNKSILIIGMAKYGQKLLNQLCIDGVNIKFIDPKISNYHRSFMVCKEADLYQGQKSDIIIDFTNGYLCVKGKTFPVNRINTTAYEQGIHEFYLN
jgi:hypothetical protein